MKRKALNMALMTIPAGIALNYIGVQLARQFALPLFLDSIGTVLAAILGGYLPGIIVGYFSNALNSLSDSITLYYGFVSVLIAAAAAFMGRRGWFRRVGTSLAATLALSLIGGGLGSVMTWLLYGFSFGGGISAPFAIRLWHETGLSQFYAQLAADMGIDLLDKFITVTIVFAVLKLLPDRFLSRFEAARCYCRDGALHPAPRQKGIRRKQSLHTDLAVGISIAGLLAGVFSVLIGYAFYSDSNQESYKNTAEGIASLAASRIDPQKVDEYLLSGGSSAEYAEVKRELEDIRNNFPCTEYLYVYQIREDGCHVVFDLDTEDVAGGRAGDIVPFDESFAAYIPALLAGQEIEAVVSDDTYGYLLTVYKPVTRADGECVCYACVDISMEDVRAERAAYIIRMITVLFGVVIVINLLAIAYIDRRMVLPLNAMITAADEFAYENEQQRLMNRKRFGELHIHTGNEIEDLYLALTKTVGDMTEYIDHIDSQSAYIARIQTNIITTFAGLVESRDGTTGEHIRRTSAYVGILAAEMRRQGKHPDVLTDEYIRNISVAAPLHDIGKIGVSDTILNKPARLTAEEFEIMKTHTTIGRRILISAADDLGQFSYLAVATDMASFHHEWWDGSGYPKGLRGDAIPLSARIMAVADVFDALVSERCYKKAIAFDEAVAIIKDESGSHFDPDVVTAFLSAGDEIRRIMADMADGTPQSMTTSC